MDRLFVAFHDQAEFFFIYIREAHPSDGSALTAYTRAGVATKRPLTLAERRQVADKACEELKLHWPCVVDDMKDAVNRAYAAWPTRLFLVDVGGRIAGAGAPGPRGLAPSIEKAEEWLREFAAKPVTNGAADRKSSAN